MKEYQQCYFAFLDLLGFKQLINIKTCSEIVQIFDEAKKQIIINEIFNDKTEKPVIPAEDIHYYIMSDSVCIFIKDDIELALPVLTFLCLYFQVRMLCLEDPVLVRGSISRGNIYENDNILFGPAMVDAYIGSEKLAHFPRVIIPAQLYNELSEQKDKSILDGIVYQDQDGFYATQYIDYFCNHNSTINYRDHVYNYIKDILNSTIEPTVKQKYMYVETLLDYYKKES